MPLQKQLKMLCLPNSLHSEQSTKKKEDKERDIRHAIHNDSKTRHIPNTHDIEKNSSIYRAIQRRKIIFSIFFFLFFLVILSPFHEVHSCPLADALITKYYVVGIAVLLLS